MVNLYLVQLALRKNTHFHSWYRIEKMYNCGIPGSHTKLNRDGEYGAGNYRLV